MNTMGHLKGISQRDSHPWVWMTSSRVVLAKSNRITWRSRWMPRLEMFSEKSWWAFSSRNRMWRRGRLVEEDNDPEWKGFQIRVDLCLGAMRSLSKRERERENTQSQPKTNRYKIKGTYAWNIHEHVTC